MVNFYRLHTHTHTHTMRHVARRRIYGPYSGASGTTPRIGLSLSRIASAPTCAWDSCRVQQNLSSPQHTFGSCHSSLGGNRPDLLRSLLGGGFLQTNVQCCWAVFTPLRQISPILKESGFDSPWEFAATDISKEAQTRKACATNPCSRLTPRSLPENLW